MKLDKEVFIVIKRNPKIEKKVREEVLLRKRKSSLEDLSSSSQCRHCHESRGQGHSGHSISEGEDSAETPRKRLTPRSRSRPVIVEEEVIIVEGQGQGQEQGHSPTEDEDSAVEIPRKRLRSRRRSVIVKEEVIIVEDEDEEDVSSPPIVVDDLRIDDCYTVPPPEDDLDLDDDYVPPQEGDDYSPQEEEEESSESSDEEDEKQATDKKKHLSKDLSSLSVSRRPNLRNRSTLKQPKKALDIGSDEEPQENESEDEDEETCEPEKLTLGTGNVVWRCPLCLRQFNRKRNVKPHVLRTHFLKKHFFCSVCDKGYFDEKDLNSHYSIHHNNEKKAENEENTTRKKTGGVEESRRHLINNSAFHKQATKVLDIDDGQNDSQENSQGNGQDKDTCHSEKLVDNDGKITWKCSLCQKNFKESDYVKRHIDRIHLQKRKVSCQFCEKRFFDKTDLNYHLRSIHDYEEGGNKEKDGNEEEEEIVTDTVSNSENEKVILRKLNAGKWKCLAPDCGKVIKQLKDARRHARSIHFKEINHICEECGQGFCLNAELRRHQRDKHGGNEASGGYACRSCGKVLSRERYRAVHEATSCKIQISEEDLKKFNIELTKCEVPDCTRIFADKKQYETHLLTHGEAEDFLCSFCGTGFKTYDLKRKHENRMHQNPDKRDFVCEICTCSYRSKHSLLAHIRSVHEGRKEEKIICDICGSHFSRRQLKKHRQDVHNLNVTPKKKGGKGKKKALKGPLKGSPKGNAKGEMSGSSEGVVEIDGEFSAPTPLEILCNAIP